MPQHNWRHRTRVYKDAEGLWNWDCVLCGTMRPRWRKYSGQLQAFHLAWNHTSVGGYYPDR